MPKESEIQPGSQLPFVSAYLTVHTYEALAPQLEGAAGLQFLSARNQTFIYMKAYYGG